jgi:hypothetical protein
LVVFFERSRDKWREKCKKAKSKNKSLKICLAKMKESRDRWKERAMALEEELKRGIPHGGRRRGDERIVGCEGGGLLHQGSQAPIPAGRSGR